MKFKKLFKFKKQHRREPGVNHFVLESLEPRLLLSATPMTAAVVTTDHLDYAPGETAVITTSNTNGDGFQFGAGELVRFQVSRTDGMADHAGSTADVGPAGNEAWYVTDGVGGFTAHQEFDAMGQAIDRDGNGVADWIAPDNDSTINGSISTTWFVEEQYRNSFLFVTAAGQESGAVATQAFTDANINTTTVVASSAPVSTYGETITFTATVTAAAGTIGPVGSVEFFDDGVSLGSDFTASNGGGLTSVFSLSRSSLSAGSHSITAVFTGATVGADTFRDSASLEILQSVNKADAVVNVNGYFAEYDGLAHGATGTATGVGSMDLSAGLNLGATFTNVADNITTWTFTGGTNYNDQSGTVLIKIVKTDPILNVTGFNTDYSATPPGPSGTPQGLFQDNSLPIPIRSYGTVLDLTATGIRNNINEDGFRYVTQLYSPGQDVTVTVAGVPASSSGHFLSVFLRVQSPNTSIVNAYYLNYEEAGANGSWVIGRLIDNTSATRATTVGTNLANGDKIRATVVGDTITAYSHHNGLWTEEISYTMTGTDIVSGEGYIGLGISANSPEINLTNVTGVFGAAAHGATGTAVGVLGESLRGLDLSRTTHSNAGTYFDTWTFKDPTGNYHDTFDAIVVNSIAKANATITVTGYNVTYNGSAHTATGTVVGVLGESLVGLNLSGTTHTNVGSYIDTWTFTDVTGNYNNASGTVSSRIDAGTAISTTSAVSSNAALSTYGDAVTFTATVIAGSGSNAPVGTVEFFDGETSLGTVSTPDSTGTGTSTWRITGAGLNAGTHSIRARFTGVVDLFNNSEGSIAQTVSQKSLTGSFTVANKLYDATTAATVLTQTLGGVLGTDDVSLIGGIATFADANAGNDKTVTLTGATLSGIGASNYSLASVNTTTADIAKAVAAITVIGYSGIYDGVAHQASGTATGVLGESLSGLDLSGTSHINAGTYGDNWTFTDVTGNYNNANGLVINVIDKAVATVTVLGYTGIYDAAAHGATGTATGVGGVDLSGGLSLGASFTNAPGGIANWTFSGGTNYTNQSGSVVIVITKANATLTLTGYVGIYDGAAHQATGTATGVLGESLAGLNLSVTSHTNAGTYLDTVTFTDVTGNYKNTVKNVKSTINKANATLTLAGYVGTYDGAAHQATGTATGVLGESLAGLNLSVTSHTNAGTYLDTVTFTDVTGNYKNTVKNVKSTINKANATLTLAGYVGTYDGAAHQATGTATGVLGESLAGLNLSVTAHTNAGVYLDTVTFTDVTGNYKDTLKNVKSTINQANATLALTGYVGTYDGAAHQATGTATGVLGESLAGLNLSSTSHTNAGTYLDTVTFTDVTGNYKDTLKNVKSTINQANAVIAVTGYSVPFDGLAHTATGTATGVLGESLAGLNLSVTSHTNAGTYLDTVTFTDVTGNYKDTLKNVKSTINQANAVIAVTGYSVPFDGLAHTATGTATGVLGESLAGLDMSSTTHSNAGTYLDTVTFTDVTGNYKNSVRNVSTRIL